MSTRNMVAELPGVLDLRRFIGRLRKLFLFWEKKATISSFSCCSIHISSEKRSNHQSASTFFPRCSSDGSTPESRIMQVKEKQKYRPQNVIRFHLQGCCCVLKRSPILPTSRDSHCDDKRFGNLLPSFRSLAFFLGSVTVKSLAL